MNAKAPSQEQVASHNLRATHEMLDTFAKSKRALESILENQTDIFAIFTETGKLISGNAALATYLKTESDVLFRSSIKTLFSNESWQLFSNKMEILKKHRERNNINFELVLDGERASSGQTYDFQWTISRFDNVSARRGNVYTVIGRDMTATKKNQERLNMVFNSVPLAIFHINREKKLTAPYSSYTEILFGLENLDQMPASDVFAKALLSSSSTQRFGLDQLLEAIGGEEFWFDIYKNGFPKELHMGTNHDGSDSWMGMNYNPVVRDGTVEEILVVAEDISDRVKNRKMKESKDVIEGTFAAIFADAREADQKTIGLTAFDVDMQLSKMADLSETTFKDPSYVLNPLHSIKGTARSAGLTWFTALVHTAEDEIVSAKDDATPMVELYVIAERRVSEIIEAWATTRNILKVMHPDALRDNTVDPETVKPQLSDAVKALEANDVPTAKALLQKLSDLLNKNVLHRLTTEIEGKVRMIASKTSASLSKEILLEVDIDECEISPTVLASLNEILTHVVSNSIDHGVESAETRQSSGKSPKGKVKVSIKKEKNHLAVSIEDDGAGVNPNKLVERALSKGIITQEWVDKASKEDKLRLIFMAGFSTKEATTDISGRGVGLDAADGTARSISIDGKGISVQSVVGRGSAFKFTTKTGI